MTDKKLVDMPFPPPMTKAEMPVWQWVYYNVRNLVSLGVATNNEDVVAAERTSISATSRPIAIWCARAAADGAELVQSQL